MGLCELGKKPCMRRHIELIGLNDVEKNVSRWRTTISKCLDKIPDTVLKAQVFGEFCNKIQKAVTIHEDEVRERFILEAVENYVDVRDKHKAAKFLEFHLDKQKQIDSANINCHNCGMLGHVVSCRGDIHECLVVKDSNLYFCRHGRVLQRKIFLLARKSCCQEMT